MGSIFFLLRIFVAVVSCVASGAYSSGPGKLDVRCIESEKSALCKLKEGSNNQSGRFSTWVVEEDCCNWRGVGCSNKTGQWHVTILDLGGHGSDEILQGEVVNSLPDLPYLSYLDLSFNDFLHGQVPELIGSLKSLEYLNLSNANFRGTIPNHLGNLSRLQILDLSGNQFALRADNLDWLHGLSFLKVLNLGGVVLSSVVDWISAVNMLPSLVKLQLSACELNSLPLILSATNFTQLEILDLSLNHFYSPMPLWLFNISHSLIVLNFKRNLLHGSIPNAIGNMSSLIILDLSENHLTGQLPKNLSMTAKDKIHRSPSLRELHLSINELKGSIPPSIAQLSELEVLDLASNLLDGVITEELLNFSNLRVLDLSSNSFKFNVSSNWTPPFRLDTIGLSCCKLGPEFPRWLRTQKGFLSIDISNNKISGAVPDWFWNLSMKVAYMNLSFNNLQGELPHFSAKHELSVLDLRSNLFDGALPQFSSSMGSLYLAKNKFYGSIVPICESLVENNSLSYLDLSTNALSGSIPDCWSRGQNLVSLRLSYNGLSGKIPYSIGNLGRLKALMLYSNALSGELPASLKYLTGLQIMDAGRNNLSGNIPAWIGENLVNLVSLILRYNQFDGNIPLQLCQLKHLVIFDLAENALSGSIPMCIDNFLTMAAVDEIQSYIYDPYTVYRTDLVNVLIRGHLLGVGSHKLFVVFDLSTNHLSGEIPGEITRLAGLVFLNLSNNRLTGVIPNDVGAMKILEGLDLSRNLLSCSIPSSMSLLYFLQILNLSYNNLSGKIPSGGQLNTFDSSIYIGNQHLCGLPLEVDCSISLYSDFSCTTDNKGIKNDDKMGGLEITSVYLSMAAGFAVGFWAFWITLLLSRSCRNAYFRFLDKWSDKIYVMVTIKVARLRSN